MATFSMNYRLLRHLQGNVFVVCRLLSSSESATVHLEYGLPRFRIPLPSRSEVCQFTMKPLSNSVADLSDSIQKEDKGIDRVAFYTTDGIRIARSNSIEQLLTNDFEIHINDRAYPVRAPMQSLELSETCEAVNDVKNLITKLSIDLNIEEYQLSRERDLQRKLERLNEELAPLEKQRQGLAHAASRRTRYLTWLGLGAMGLQFGLLARLTWWEYSWDIMEPVTYFVGYGTSIAMFAYYVITRQEYVFPAVFDREYLKKFYADADKQKFDIDVYNDLREQISTVESDMRRLRDPLMLNLPMQQLLANGTKKIA